ncbi:MAG TPA: hypothetical protein VFY90_07930 [Tepidiformaceae bacterium]|nr:hypothetical protein [Tepidiformaceae bacterium]
MKGGFAGLVTTGLLFLAPAIAAAQGYSADVSVNGGSFELRGLRRDSLPESQVPGEGQRRALEDGTVVTCIPDEFCRWFPSGDVESVSLLTQDLRAAFWPGIEGLAAQVHLRARYGSDDFWPRAEQELEALYAFVSYEDTDYRVRAGRQQRINGLGYYNFDGASFLWRGFDPVRIDLYGGWSLARNLNAPRTGSLLEDADEFAPDDRGLIVGIEVQGRIGSRATGAVTYQREIRDDRLALYTERVAGDLGVRVSRFSVELGIDYDLAFEEFNEASLRVSAPVAAGVEAMAQVRRYTPHFELWTIWGAFSPVGFDETRGWLAWNSPGGDVRLEAGGAYRTYEDTDAGAQFAQLEDDGWRAFGRVRWDRDAWFAEGSYRAEEGSGAARYGGDLALGRGFGPGRYVALRGTSSQNFSEFRLGEQVTAGGGLDAAWRLGDVTLTGGWTVYRLAYDGQPRVSDWTQQRLRAGASYHFGTEPETPDRIGGYR